MPENEIEGGPILPAMPGPWGEAIRMLRARKNLLQQTVAKRAKMTATTYGKIEKGGHTQTRKLQDIAEVFGVSIDSVLHNSLLQTQETVSDTAPVPTPKEAHGGSSVHASPSEQENIAGLRARVRKLEAKLQRMASRERATPKSRRRTAAPRKSHRARG